MSRVGGIFQPIFFALLALLDLTASNRSRPNAAPRSPRGVRGAATGGRAPAPRAARAPVASGASLERAVEVRNALQAAFLAHLVMCGLLFVFGFLCRFRIAYLIGWMIIVACLVLEHWIARRRSLNWVNLAFFRLNAVISAVFLLITLAEVVFQGGFRLR